MALKYFGQNKSPEREYAAKTEASHMYTYDDSHDADSLDEGSDDENYLSHRSKGTRIPPPSSLVRRKLDDIRIKKHASNEAVTFDEENRVGISNYMVTTMMRSTVISIISPNKCLNIINNHIL